MELFLHLLLVLSPFEPGPWEQHPGNETAQISNLVTVEVLWCWNPGPISWHANAIDPHLVQPNHKIYGDQFPTPNLNPAPPWPAAYNFYDPEHALIYWTEEAGEEDRVDPGYSYKREVRYTRHTGEWGFFREYAPDLFQHVTRYRDEAVDISTIHEIAFYVDPDDRG